MSTPTIEPETVNIILPEVSLEEEIPCSWTAGAICVEPAMFRVITRPKCTCAPKSFLVCLRHKRVVERGEWQCPKCHKPVIIKDIVSI